MRLASPIMTPPRARPPYAANERVQLVGWLTIQRALVPFKCEGLSEEDAHRAVPPSSPLVTMCHWRDLGRRDRLLLVVTTCASCTAGVTA
jgi:hypothetical protein